MFARNRSQFVQDRFYRSWYTCGTRSLQLFVEDIYVARCSPDVWNCSDPCSDDRLRWIDDTGRGVKGSVWDAGTEDLVAIADRILSSGPCTCGCSNTTCFVPANWSGLCGNPTAAGLASSNWSRCGCTADIGWILCHCPFTGPARPALYGCQFACGDDLDHWDRADPRRVIPK